MRNGETNKSLNDLAIDKVEKDVLKVYKKEIPSLVGIDVSEEDYKAQRKKQEILFRDRLKFPPKMFEGSSVLDLGAGTGEDTIFFSLWGAHCTLVDNNLAACKRAEEIFKLFAPPQSKHKICNTSLFQFDTKERFDITHSNGVLQHTADVKRAFAIQVRYLKPGGYIILGMGNKSGYFQRNLQRFILYSLADSEKILLSWRSIYLSSTFCGPRNMAKERKKQLFMTVILTPKSIYFRLQKYLTCFPSTT